MPRFRSPENVGLPLRWRFTRNAYYYQVPPGLEDWWDFKQTYRLGTTFDEALAEYTRISARGATSKDIDHSKLLNISTIQTNAANVVFAGVYFLLFNSEVVYVGRSERIFERIAQHVAIGIIEFDGFHAVAAQGLEQTRLEQVYIGKFRPKHNIRGVRDAC